MKHKFMKRTLAVVGISTLLFTVAMIYLFYIYQAVPDSLVAAFYVAMAGEGGFCALIRRADGSDESEAGNPDGWETTEEETED